MSDKQEQEMNIENTESYLQIHRPIEYLRLHSGTRTTAPIFVRVNCFSFVRQTSHFYPLSWLLVWPRTQINIVHGPNKAKETLSNRRLILSVKVGLVPLKTKTLFIWSHSIFLLQDFCVKFKLQKQFLKQKRTEAKPNIDQLNLSLTVIISLSGYSDINIKIAWNNISIDV